VQTFAQQLHREASRITTEIINRTSMERGPVVEIAEKGLSQLGNKFTFKEFRNKCQLASDTKLDIEKFHFSGKNTKFDYCRVLRNKGYIPKYDEKWSLYFEKNR
jgi:hypothetical protein